MQNEDILLVIGDKAWSSWSLRPWLAAKVAKVPFQEVLIRLRRADTAAQIAMHSPSERVPVLHHGDLVIWDSLAICEYLAELAPEAGLWPSEQKRRAVARSASAEMHSSFQSLRTEFPMDFHARIAGRAPSTQARTDIERVVSIWTGIRREFGGSGPFLFGAFTIADAMFAPVATRFRTYGFRLADFGDDGVAESYMQSILAMPEMEEWGAGASSV